ncbi:MAG: type ISP restriction/modification enzyme [Gammaproteobacteria bacterium]
MAAKHWLSRYIDDIGEKRAAGGNTEVSYRTPIERMMEKAAAEFCADVDITHEPERTKDLGAPDFLISAKGGGVVGYVECKKPGADLQKKTTKAQVEKYRALSENILLTDSFRWMHFRDGKITADILLTSKPDKRKREEFAEVLRRFMMTPPEKVADSKQLAETLARRCVILREGLAMHEDNEQSRLHGLLGEFRRMLDRDLNFPRFADFFAQTLIYSLLMAKLNSPAGEKLTLANVRERIPENFAVIREIAVFLAELADNQYRDIRWIIGDILATINGMDEAAIAETMSYKKGIGEGDDPYINFYETFLAEYDPKLRESRGVYYTPPPVVRFIVRAADDLLRRDFNMPKGLAERKVTALDFAAGTGTFMLEMARLLFDGKDKAKVNMLARGNFLPNFYGFEMMASAYVISHLKLSRFLTDNGIALQDGESIKIYLANTLEKLDKQIELSLMPSLAREAKAAQEVKDKRVLVIVGNPPYSGHSQNKSEEHYYRDHKKIKGKRVKDTRHTWIGGLLHGIDDGKNVGGSYYEIDGEPLDEKNPKWLQDDYVKFIRFAQHKMDMVPRGIVAVITNHGFLDNPTFRGMRQSLMKTFDALYFLDLHGNSKKKEKAPDGGKDENVFDIQQGVAVSLLVKNSAAKEKGVFHADLWGARKKKYEECAAQNIGSANWRKLTPAAPFYLFVPRDKRAEKKNGTFYPVRDIFAASSAGLLTARDKLTIAFSETEMRECIKAFSGMPPEEAREHFNLPPDTRDWGVVCAQNDLSAKGGGGIRRIAYRPFDFRFTYYTGNSRGFHCRPRGRIMRHMLKERNIGLLLSRQQGVAPLSVHVVNDIVDGHCGTDSTSITYLFPLRLCDGEMNGSAMSENFTAKFRRWIDERYGEAHTPEDILGCIYAVLHSPDYRHRYADFLRTDFPRIPFPESNDKFKRLAAIGNELINAHLLRANCGSEYGELRGSGISNQVDKVRYDENAACLYFNKDQYFAPIPPEVFNFQIGGYKPLDKYLKSRKGRKLSPDEVDTIEKAANAIAFTIAKIGEIDD